MLKICGDHGMQPLAQLEPLRDKALCWPRAGPGQTGNLFMASAQRRWKRFCLTFEEEDGLPVLLGLTDYGYNTPSARSFVTTAIIRRSHPDPD